MKRKPSPVVTPEQIGEAIKAPVCAKLQAIIDRGSDGCFTTKENETFDSLIEFIRDETNSITDRVRACYQYDSMMGETDVIIDLWTNEGPEAAIKDFIETLYT